MNRLPQHALLIVGFGLTEMWAQERPSGEIAGSVKNLETGSYLANAQIRVEGTGVIAVTDSQGKYRLGGIPPGERTLRASFQGMEAASRQIQVRAGERTAADFALALAREAFGFQKKTEEEIVKLEEMVVTDTLLAAQAVALNEQRMAPNIKNVVSSVEYGDIGEVNIGEFVQFVPGVQIEYSANMARGIQVRGVPSAGTLIMVDGFQTTSADTTSRSVILDPFQLKTIDRIEITKVPTPDLPANAQGGSVNAVTKSGFDRSRPQGSIKGYALLNSNSYRGFRRNGRQDLNTNGINPGVEFSYMGSWKDTIGIALSATRSRRAYFWEDGVLSRDLVTGIPMQNQAYYGDDERLRDSTSMGAKLDWRNRSGDSLQVSFSRFNTIANSIDAYMQQAFGAGATGGPDWAQGAATGVGTITRNFQNHSYNLRQTDQGSVFFKHLGKSWDFRFQAGYAKSRSTADTTNRGNFSGVSHSLSNLIIKASGIGAGFGPDASSLTVVSRTGAPVNFLDVGDYVIGSATGADPYNLATTQGLKANVSRTFANLHGIRLQSGVQIDKAGKDFKGGTKTWNFRPGASTDVRQVKNYEVTLPYKQWYRAIRAEVTALDPTALFGLYRSRPEYFVLNEATSYQSTVAASREIHEAVSAGYLRADFQFWDKRLWVVGGARYERTKVEGWGMLDDISATYVKDANGNPLRDSAGRVRLVTTNALESNRLRYKERQAYNNGQYDGYYPSLNATYNLRKDWVLRAAYALTISRPNMSLIIPGVTIPDADSVNPVISVVNTALKPWESDNYDLSLESYQWKGATLAISGYQKDFRKFIYSTYSEVTDEFLEKYGLPDNYSSFTLATQKNGGNARIRGVDIGYRQDWGVFHRWLRGFNSHLGYTKMNLSGSDSENFTPFNPGNLTWGVGYKRGGFSVRLNAVHSQKIKNSNLATSATTPAGSKDYVVARKVFSGSMQWFFTKRLSLDIAVVNLTNAPRTLVRGAPNPATGLWPYRTQVFGVDYTVGVTGRF